MASRKSGSKTKDWRSKLITFAYNDADIEIIKRFRTQHSDTPLAGTVESFAGEGHGIKFKYSEYYASWIFSVTFGERIKHLEGYTVMMYHREFDASVALLHYLFEVMVENGDDRLVSGGLPIGDF